ncbi:MFS polyamine transporter [Thelephora ganbajun]|uniref:MFS polyamine transporter n=1 Tax=Thelephora ganbajun TaxID=370292 RepID=A0ACB6ZSC3_THEGA|nr:MFS polyamine transporter [Thelephora ganbajun]
MSDHTLHSEKSSISRRNSEAASELLNKDSLAHDLSEDRLSPNVPDVTVNADINVHIVDWDGPDDPFNPKNWSFKKKWGATIIVSAFAFISPVSSSMVAPASGQVAADFAITSEAVVAMTISVFTLAHGGSRLLVNPLVKFDAISPSSRSRVLQMANMWYLAWNLGCGFAQNKEQLIAFRFLAGLGGSAALSICGGVISDTWHPEERGMAMGLYTLAPFLGPAIGPMAGAWIAEKSRWRWVFWSTSIFDGFIQILGFLYLKETYAPVLLERKAQVVRNILGDPEKGQQPREVRTIYTNVDRHWKSVFKKALTRPFVLFSREPIIQVAGLYMMFVYGLLYIFLTTLPAIFGGVYRERPGIAGLNYIALGVGITGASQTSAVVMDKLYAKLKQKYGTGKPEFRLLVLYPSGVLIPVGLLITGWTVENKGHWIGADVGLTLVGAGIILVFQGVQAYIIDSYSLHAASGKSTSSFTQTTADLLAGACPALAAVYFLRPIAGFGFPIFAPGMFKYLGYGVGNTVLAVITIVIGAPAPILFWKFGERIRNASAYAVKTPPPMKPSGPRQVADPEIRF